MGEIEGGRHTALTMQRARREGSFGLWRRCRGGHRTRCPPCVCHALWRSCWPAVPNFKDFHWIAPLRLSKQLHQYCKTTYIWMPKANTGAERKRQFVAPVGHKMPDTFMQISPTTSYHKEPEAEHGLLMQVLREVTTWSRCVGKHVS